MSLVSCMKYTTKPIKFINMNDLCDNSVPNGLAMLSADINNEN